MISYLLTDSALILLERQDQDVGLQIRRWRPVITTLTRKLSQLTGDSPDDIVSDFALKIYTDVGTWKTKQVRQKGQIWEVLDELPEDVLRLRRVANGKTTEIFLKCSETEKIEKASLGTFVYSGLRQYYADRCASLFTAKNGYAPNEKDPTTTVRSADGKTKVYPNFTKVTGVNRSSTVIGENGVELDVVDLVPCQQANPEENAVFESIIEFLCRHLSPEAQRLLNFVLQRDDDFHTQVDLEILRSQSEGEVSRPVVRIDDAIAAKYLSISRAGIKALRLEIIEALPQAFLDSTMVAISPNGEISRSNLVRNVLGSAG
jgi:hypothetical protein